MLQAQSSPETHPNVSAWSIGVGFLVIIPGSAAMLVACLRINGVL